MECDFQFTSWQGMYNQLLYKYSTLAFQYQQQTQTNFTLYSQLQNLMQQQITLLQDSQNQVPVLPTLPSLPVITNINNQEAIPVPPVGNKLKKKNKKRSRRHRIRRNSEIYLCPYNGCRLKYHSAISMNLHIKIKHNGGTKKERQAYAIMLLQSLENGTPPPVPALNLPPNFLEEFKRNYSYIKKYNM